MLKKILIAFVSLWGLVLALGFVLPATYRVERSLLVLAPSETVYAHLAQPRRWGEWTPWNAEHYPQGTWTFGGPERGTGSVRSWSGAPLGQGTLSLSEANPLTGVAYQAALDEGRASARGHISLAPVEGGTQVTWVDEGRVGGNPLRRYLVPLVRSRLGGGLEEGLARLKRVAETSGAGLPREEPTSDADSPSPVPPGPLPAAPSLLLDGGAPPVLALEDAAPAPEAHPPAEADASVPADAAAPPPSTEDAAPDAGGPR